MKIDILMQILLITFLLACAISDVRTKHVNIWVIGMFAAAIIWVRWITESIKLDSMAAALSIGFFLYIISLISEERIGKGDGLVVMVIGLYLGFMRTMEVVWVATVLIAVAGLIYILTGKEKNYELPFVPFLFGSYALIFAGEIVARGELF